MRMDIEGEKRMKITFNYNERKAIINDNQAVFEFRKELDVARELVSEILHRSHSSAEIISGNQFIIVVVDGDQTKILEEFD